MRIEGSPLPFHIAKAYGVSPIARAAPIAPVAPAERPTAGARSLIGGIVPGKVDFSGQEPAPSAPAIQFYRHPADRNAAATAIDAGRMVDLTA